MNSLVVLSRGIGGKVLRSTVRLGSEGDPPTSAASKTAAKILDYFGLSLPELRYSTDNSDPSDGGVLLASTVLLVANALALTIKPGSAIALKLADKQLARFDAAAEDLLAALSDQDQQLLLDDNRPAILAPSPAEKLRELALEKRPNLHVRGVSSLEQVLTVLLDGRDWMTATSNSQEVIARSAAHLFAAVMPDAKNLLGWDTIVSIARGQLARATSDGNRNSRIVRWKLEFARDVARRHCGESVPAPWADDDMWEAFSSTERLAIAAHIVQGAADSDARLVPTAIDFAKETIEADGQFDKPRTAEAWGAMGRAYASVGEYGDSIAILTRACKAWQDLGQVPKMSYAACELVRVATRSLVEAGEWSKQCRSDPDLSDNSKAFLLLAEGRSASELGNHIGALGSLDDPGAAWHNAPDHVKRARLRWRHRTLLQLGRDREAQDTLQELARDGETDQLCLAKLDLALEKDGDWRKQLEELIAVIPEGQEAVRTLERIGVRIHERELWTRDHALRLAGDYRY